MIQKVIKVGSSAAITIPKKVLQDLGLSIGDTVRTNSNPSSKQFSVEPTTSIRPEVVQWTDEFIEKNRELLKELADK